MSDDKSKKNGGTNVCRIRTSLENQNLIGMQLNEKLLHIKVLFSIIDPGSYTDYRTSLNTSLNQGMVDGGVI